MTPFARLFALLITGLLLGPAVLRAEDAPAATVEAAAAPDDGAATDHAAAPAGHAAGPAQHAAGHEAQAAHAGHHTWVIGAKGTLLNSIVDGRVVDSPAGFGLSGETTVIPGWLEVEAAARLLDGQHALQLPVDVLFKLPLPVNAVVQPFVGAGPTMVLAFPRAVAPARHVGGEGDGAAEGESSHETGPAVHAGVATVLGSYFWLQRDVGAVVELNYNMVFEAELAHELGGAIGLVVGF